MQNILDLFIEDHISLRSDKFSASGAPLWRLHVGQHVGAWDSVGAPSVLTAIWILCHRCRGCAAPLPPATQVHVQIYPLCVHACAQVHMCVQEYAYMWAHIPIHICMSVCRYTMYICIHAIRTYMLLYIHVLHTLFTQNTYVHMYICIHCRSVHRYTDRYRCVYTYVSIKHTSIIYLLYIIDKYLQICTYMYMWLYKCICVCVYIQHTHVFTYVYVNILHIQKYTCVCMYLYMYIYYAQDGYNDIVIQWYSGIVIQ